MLPADLGGSLQPPEVFLFRVQVGIVKEPDGMVSIFEEVDHVGGTGSATDVKQEEGLPLRGKKGRA
jgi:hypothetical protein